MTKKYKSKIKKIKINTKFDPKGPAPKEKLVFLSMPEIRGVIERHGPPKMTKHGILSFADDTAAHPGESGGNPGYGGGDFGNTGSLGGNLNSGSVQAGTRGGVTNSSGSGSGGTTSSSAGGSNRSGGSSPGSGSGGSNTGGSNTAGGNMGTRGGVQANAGGGASNRSGGVGGLGGDNTGGNNMGTRGGVQANANKSAVGSSLSGGVQPGLSSPAIGGPSPGTKGPSGLLSGIDKRATQYGNEKIQDRVSNTNIGTQPGLSSPGINNQTPVGLLGVTTTAKRDYANFDNDYGYGNPVEIPGTKQPFAGGSPLMAQVSPSAREPRVSVTGNETVIGKTPPGATYGIPSPPSTPMGIFEGLGGFNYGYNDLSLLGEIPSPNVDDMRNALNNPAPEITWEDLTNLASFPRDRLNVNGLPETDLVASGWGGPLSGIQAPAPLNHPNIAGDLPASEQDRLLGEASALGIPGVPTYDPLRSITTPSLSTISQAPKKMQDRVAQSELDPKIQDRIPGLYDSPDYPSDAPTIGGYRNPQSAGMSFNPSLPQQPERPYRGPGEDLYSSNKYSYADPASFTNYQSPVNPDVRPQIGGNYPTFDSPVNPDVRPQIGGTEPDWAKVVDQLTTYPGRSRIDPTQPDIQSAGMSFTPDFPVVGAPQYPGRGVVDPTRDWQTEVAYNKIANAQIPDLPGKTGMYSGPGNDLSVLNKYSNQYSPEERVVAEEPYGKIPDRLSPEQDLASKYQDRIPSEQNQNQQVATNVTRQATVNPKTDVTNPDIVNSVIDQYGPDLGREILKTTNVIKSAVFGQNKGSGRPRKYKRPVLYKNSNIGGVYA